MPHGGQSSFPVPAALPGQVSGETATFDPAIVHGKGQWLRRTETLCQVLRWGGGLLEAGGCRKEQRGRRPHRLGVARGVSQALPVPLPSPCL
jgi:hypothetical protein